jgi:hypothetical protein
MNLEKDFILQPKSNGTFTLRAFDCISLPVSYVERTDRVTGSSKKHAKQKTLNSDAKLQCYFWFYCPYKNTGKGMVELAELRNLPVSDVSEERLSLLLLKYSSL